MKEQPCRRSRNAHADIPDARICQMTYIAKSIVRSTLARVPLSAAMAAGGEARGRVSYEGILCAWIVGKPGVSRQP